MKKRVTISVTLWYVFIMEFLAADNAVSFKASYYSYSCETNEDDGSEYIA